MEKIKLESEVQKSGVVNTWNITFLSRAWPFALILVGIALFFGLGWDRYLTFDALSENRESLLKWTTENRILAISIYFIGYTLIVACSVPGATLMTLVGGFLFGAVIGTTAVVISATLGAVLIFLTVRYTVGDFFQRKMGKISKRMESGFRENALSFILFLRLVPIFPFWLVNIIPAFMGVPLKLYLVGTIIGIIPASAVYGSVGSGLGLVFEMDKRPDLEIISQPHIFAPLIGLAILSVLPVIYKRFKFYR